EGGGEGGGCGGGWGRGVRHDQGRRQRHGAGSEPSLRLRQAVGRYCSHHQRGRSWHGDHALSAAHAGIACAFDRAHGSRSRAAAGWHGALVVEDSPEVAEVATAYFQQLGYMVKQVANAHEALELLANDPKIDLVFSDILMPGGMNGLELAHAIRRLYPAMPVLLATGYSDSGRDAVQQGFVVLPK